MKILIVCEESQIVTKKLRSLGHEAYSNDLKPESGGHPEWHKKGDCFDVIKQEKWDMIIMHPPCTYLTVAGNRHYAKGKEKYNERIAAAKFVQDLWYLATSVCSKVVMENPVGCISTMCKVPKAQYVQPFWFGDNSRKKTGLWLHGLNPLERTHFDVEPELISYVRSDGRTTTFSADYMRGVDRSGKMKASTKRSKTYDGIATAMALQWAGECL